MMNPFVYIILAIIFVVIFMAYNKTKSLGRDQEKWINYLIDNDRFNIIIFWSAIGLFVALIMLDFALEPLKKRVGALPPVLILVPALFLIAALVNIAFHLILSAFFIWKSKTTVMDNVQKRYPQFYMSVFADIIFLISGSMLPIVLLDAQNGSYNKLIILLLICASISYVRFIRMFLKHFL